MKLNIGCINYRHGGYIHFDIHNHLLWDSGPFADKYTDHRLHRLDVLGDACMLPFKSSCFDEIYTSHALEHISLKGYHIALNEFYRVLKNGGFLDITVPNLEHYCKLFLENKLKRRDYLKAFYGEQNWKADFHCSGFTKEILVEDCLSVGFSSVKLIDDVDVHLLVLK